MDEFTHNLDYSPSLVDFSNIGNGEPGTGVWERVYSGDPLKNSKWRTKEKQSKML